MCRVSRMMPGRHMACAGLASSWQVRCDLLERDARPGSRASGSTMAAGQNPVKADWIRFRPTKTVSSSQYGETKYPSASESRTMEPAKSSDGAIDRHCHSPWLMAGRLFGGLDVDVLELLDAEHVEREVLVEGLGSCPGGSCCRKYFSKPILAACTHLPCDDQLTLRGGICGCATKAMPSSPKSARQTAFQVATACGSSPRSSAAMFVGRGRHHRFDHEAGLRHADRQRRLADRRDGDADADREDVRKRRVALVLVDGDEAARVGQPLDAARRRRRRGRPAASSR